MEDESENQFKELIEKRNARGKMAGGEMFAFWGILNLISYFIFILLWHSDFVWPVMIIIGMTIQVIYVRNLEKDKGYQLFWFKNTSQLWLFLVVLMPLIFYIFPFVLKMYKPMTIFPLIFLWLSAGLMISGIIVEQLCFKLGAAVMACAAVLTVLFFSLVLYIYPVSILLGLIIPGVWSRYEEN
ncbi:MAG: hypothetical protein ABSG94_06790 [Brevinematales bacterium]|jgi:hypothetical protein